MSASSRALIALVAGLTAGTAIAWSGNEYLNAIVWVLEPLGTLWVNAVRMTIIPLVISLLLVSVSAGGALGTVGRLGGRALLFFSVVLTGIGVVTALLAPAMLAPLEIDPAAAASLRARAAETTGTVNESVKGLPTPMQWLVTLVPVNPIRAAADGAMLPLIIFTIALAAALTRVEASVHQSLTGVFNAVAHAMLIIVGWLFVVAPIGVFALGLAVATRIGIAAVGAVGWYIVVFSILMIIVGLAMYPIVMIWGRVGVRRFATAAAPAQAIAFSSRSSSVALPAMILAARDKLGLAPVQVNFVLPLAVTLFRVSVPVSMPLGALFLAKLYGVDITGSQLAALVATSVLLSFSVPPIPSGSLFLIAPVLAGAGIPAEGLGILIAADAIPDLFKTTAIVTSHMTAAAVVGSRPARADPEVAAPSDP